MKKILVFLVINSFIAAFAAPRPADKPFTWSTDLTYPFMPKQKMTFIKEAVRNTGSPRGSAVKVDNRTFKLPGRICRSASACYKADLNGDKIPDYIFVSIKVMNGRFAGRSDVGFFVSNPRKKYTFSAFETQHLEAEIVNGRVMMIKYARSDDDITFIRQFYTFTAEGRLRLHRAEKFAFKYGK